MYLPIERVSALCGSSFNTTVAAGVGLVLCGSGCDVSVLLHPLVLLIENMQCVAVGVVSILQQLFWPTE